MTVKRYRKLPVEIDAVQWDGTHERAHELIRWTGDRRDKDCPHFVVLNTTTAQRIFGLLKDNVATPHQRWTAEGRTAALWVEANASWVPLHTDEWVAKDDAGFYPIKDEIFVKSYKEVTDD